MEGSEGICFSDLDKIEEMVDEDSICFFYDKMCQRPIDLEEMQQTGVLVKEAYVRYSPNSLENRLVFFGWCKNQRLPNGVYSKDQYA